MKNFHMCLPRGQARARSPSHPPPPPFPFPSLFLLSFFTSAFFVTWVPSVAQASLELSVHLPLPPVHWDYRCVAAHLAEVWISAPVWLHQSCVFYSDAISCSQRYHQLTDCHPPALLKRSRNTWGTCASSQGTSVSGAYSLRRPVSEG